MRRLFYLPRCLLWTVVGLFVAAAAWADDVAPEKKEGGARKPTRVEVQAVVVKYTPNALHDSFDDGSFAFYDGVTLKIVAPMKHAGMLRIFLGRPADEKSPWRAIGETIRFRINAEALLRKSNEQWFDGSVERLELWKKTP